MLDKEGDLYTMKNEFNHLVKGLDPVADAFSGTVTSDIVNMKNHGKVQFIIYKGVGTTGTSDVTVETCSDVSGSDATAIAFHYQAITSDDTHGSYTAATSSGFTTTAGSSQLYKIDVNVQELLEDGYEYVRLKMVEDTADPVIGCILINLTEPRYNQAVQDTVLE